MENLISINACLRSLNHSKRRQLMHPINISLYSNSDKEMEAFIDFSVENRSSKKFSMEFT